MHFVDAKGILTGSGGHYGMNIYRGCSHGCIYCDSRSRCYRFTHPFEDIEVKQNAPELLEKALKSKRRKCMIGTGAMSDPYMHCEEELRLTRKCLEIILQYGFGVAIQTKSDRILQDIDLLDEINRSAKCVVQMTLTTYDDDLCRILEPNVCNTKRRIEVLEEMQKREIPTVVWLTPILPFINDTEENITSILNECIRVGVKGIIDFGMGLTLREGDREYYYAALDRHFPGMKERYIKRYGNAYELPSPNAKKLTDVFQGICKANGILSSPEDCFRFMHELPEKYRQMSIFDLNREADYMEYIRVTKDNLEKEHICCAISNNKDAQVSSKKAWLADRFDEGLVFLKSVERGKCFIEYIPAENAWVPIDADGYMYIDCLWVSGSFKGHGYSTDLLNECIEDSKTKGKAGLCILAAAKKKPFLADPKFLKYKGFVVGDEADNGIQLWYLPFEKDAGTPKFKECAKRPHIDEKGYVLYYTSQCPFNAKYVPVLEQTARENDISFHAIHIDSREEAQNAPTPITNYALFHDGEYITNEQMNDKKFLKLVNG